MSAARSATNQLQVAAAVDRRDRQTDTVPIHRRLPQWSSQDLEVGAQGVWGTDVPQRGPGEEPLVGGSGGGTASRKLIAVFKDIWLPNRAQFCVS